MNVNDKIALAIGHAHLQKVITEAQLEAANERIADLEGRIAALEPKTGEPDEPEAEAVRTEGERADGAGGSGAGSDGSGESDAASG